MNARPILATLTHRFEDDYLVTLFWKGQPAWVARHVGTILGYAHNGELLCDTILGPWASEFAEGRDYVVLTGEDLDTFHRLSEGTGAEVSTAPDRSLLLLTRTGLHLVLIMVSAPPERRLRHFLVDLVLPQVVGMGDNLGAPSLRPLPPRPGFAQPGVDPLARRSLSHRRWVEQRDRTLQVRVIHRLLDRLGDEHLSPATRASLEVAAAEIALGVRRPVVLPAVPFTRSRLAEVVQALSKRVV